MSIVVANFICFNSDTIAYNIYSHFNPFGAQVYGICIAGNNVYYTDKRTNLYGVKKHGGGIATISESMKGPRGCAWDGDGTIYVADMEGGKVDQLSASNSAF